MSTKHLLYLTNQQLTALVWRSHRAVSVEMFDVDDAGVVAFSQYLEKQAGLPAYLMLDLIEEDFRLDTVPRVGGRDRATILARRLQQIYRGTPFRHAQLQGQEPDGRRDWRVLYTAITNSDLLHPWIAALQAHRIPLVGIYSAPLLVTGLLKALRPLTRHALIVSLHESAGLRQNYVRDGYLKFSRLTPLGDTTTSLLPHFIGEETERTWQYLNSLNHFAANEHLQVVIVTDRSGETALRPVLVDTTQLRYEYRNIPEVAERLGMRDTPAGRNAAALYVHALGERPPANHFAAPELTHYASLRRVRIGLWFASALVLLVCGASAALDWNEGHELAAATASNETEAVRVHADENLVRKMFPPTRVRPDLMNATVAFYNSTVADAPALEPFLGRLSQTLPGFPAVRLSQIVWSLSRDAKFTPVYTQTVHGNGGHLQNTLSTQRRPAPAAGPPAATQPGYFQVAVLEGAVVGAASDYRHALDIVHSLESALAAAWPGCRVEELAMPIDPGSQVGLQGRVEPEEGTNEAPFVLKVVVDPVRKDKVPGRIASAGAER